MNGTMFVALATMLVAGISFPSSAASQQSGSVASLREALTFSASFDQGSDADFAKGDKQIYTALSPLRKDPKPGLPAGEIEVARGQGRHGGDALRFIKKSDKVIFYQVAGNLDYRKQNWSGTASFWLSLDPQLDLGDWYCDPIQITEKAWNDGALWVDFSKDEKPKLFRLGALADLKVWNPTNHDFEKMTAADRPMCVATHPTFSRETWTHVVITFENFNTGQADGTAKLYLNGERQGAVSGRNQVYSWNPDKAAIMLGMGYVGRFDDLTLFNRALSESEIQILHRQKGDLVKPN